MRPSYSYLQNIIKWTTSDDVGDGESILHFRVQ